MHLAAPAPNHLTPQRLADGLALWLEAIACAFLALLHGAGAYLPRAAVRVIDDGARIGVHAFETYLKALIVLRAGARFTPAPPQGAAHPRFAPRGFHRRALPRNSHFRLITRGLLADTRADDPRTRIRRHPCAAQCRALCAPSHRAP
ncbi:MAG: hypothetical protein WDM79_05850 [Terricaulis sp.]